MAAGTLGGMNRSATSMAIGVVRDGRDPDLANPLTVLVSTVVGVQR